MSVRLLLVVAALLAVLSLGAAGPPSEGELLLQRAIQKERVDGDLKAALKLYQTVLDTAKDDRPVAAEALLRMGQCHEKLGHAEARAAYERLVRDYPDQAEKVQVARQRLTALDSHAGQRAGGAAPPHGGQRARHLAGRALRRLPGRQGQLPARRPADREGHARHRRHPGDELEVLVRSRRDLAGQQAGRLPPAGRRRQRAARLRARRVRDACAASLAEYGGGRVGHRLDAGREEADRRGERRVQEPQGPHGRRRRAGPVRRRRAEPGIRALGRALSRRPVHRLRREGESGEGVPRRLPVRRGRGAGHPGRLRPRERQGRRLVAERAGAPLRQVRGVRPGRLERGDRERQARGRAATRQEGSRQRRAAPPQPERRALSVVVQGGHRRVRRRVRPRDGPRRAPRAVGERAPGAGRLSPVVSRRPFLLLSDRRRIDMAVDARDPLRNLGRREGGAAPPQTPELSPVARAVTRRPVGDPGGIRRGLQGRGTTGSFLVDPASGVDRQDGRSRPATCPGRTARSGSI